MTQPISYLQTDPRNVCRINMLRDISERLKMVVVENLSFDTLISRYDNNSTLFYYDPPYFGTESIYSVQFGENEHRRLRDVLAGVKVRFILTASLHVSYTGVLPLRKLGAAITWSAGTGKIGSIGRLFSGITDCPISNLDRRCTHPF